MSRQIRLLEEALGARLFERDHKGVRLTDAGQRLLPFIGQAFDTIERGVGEIVATRPGARRRLTVSLPPTFATQWFSPRLGTLARRCPTSSCRSARSRMTIAIATSASGAARAGMQSELLMMERHALVGAPRYRGDALDVLLGRLPSLHVLHEGKRLTLWADWCEQAGVPPARIGDGIEFSTLEQAIRAARKGAGPRWSTST